MDFRYCKPVSCESDLVPRLVDMLNNIEHLISESLIITSAFRSQDYELSKSRSGSSSHCNRVAVDVSCRDSVSRLKIVQAALRSGFRRIGISDTFIHLDIDDLKPDCIWLY